MNRETWNLIKNNKNFNVHIFRRGLFVLVASLSLSCIITLLLFYVYITEPERDYYATDGVTPPVKLNSLLARNLSATALLAPDPPSDLSEKLIPQ